LYGAAIFSSVWEAMESPTYTFLLSSINASSSSLIPILSGLSLIRNMNVPP